MFKASRRRSSKRMSITRRDRSKSSLVSLNVAWKKLLDVTLLESTERSNIYKALYNSMPVIVKTVNPKCKDLARVENNIENELSKLLILSNGHDNIVHLNGAGYTPKGYRYLILEYLEHGTLAEYIYDKKTCVNRGNVLGYARSLADAMNYCHGRDARKTQPSIILHRDLKPDNIGFGADGKLKLFDFGMASMLENAAVGSGDVYNLSGGLGSIRYMAPEVANHECYNEKVDVYSFGIILWEMLSMREAYEGVKELTLIDKVIDQNLRPELDPTWPEELLNLMERCWGEEISKRPTFEEIYCVIDSLIPERNASE